MNEFFNLSPDVVQSIAAVGMTRNESRLFFHLLQLDPFGNLPIRVNVDDIIRQCCLKTRSLYYRIMAKFEKLGWFGVKNNEITIENFTCKPQKQEPDLATDTSSVRQRDLYEDRSDLIDRSLYIDQEKEIRSIDQIENIQLSEITVEAAIAEIRKEIPDNATEKNLEQSKVIVNDNSFKIAVENFVLKSLNLSPHNRKAYFAKISPSDWKSWEAKYREAHTGSTECYKPYTTEQTEFSSPDSQIAQDAIAKIKSILPKPKL